MRDLKYIIKRILIGVGIILVLSFIRGNKVNALTSLQMENNQMSPAIPTYCENKKRILITTQFFTHLQYPNFDISYNNPPNPSASLHLFCFDTDITDFNFGSNFVNYVNSFSTRKVYQYKSRSWSEITGGYGAISNGLNFELTGTTACPYPNEFGCLIWNNSSYGDFITSGTVMYTDFEKVRSNNIIYYDSSITFSSKIVSLNPVKLNSENGVIITYLFSPEFSNFNPVSYSYQYKFGNGTIWLSLTENEQVFRVNNNGTIYVRVKDKNTNEVVDSQTFTITDIGTFATNQDYNITFSGEYRTENYLNDNISSKSQSKIQEYQIYVDYTPKTSILKYQYQYVINGDFLNNDNWQNVASSDNGSFTYVATENGTLYARILDSSDNNLYSATFTVNSIGLLAIDSNEKGIDNFLTKLSNKINYGGPVSSLFIVPINLLNSLYTPISNSDSCSNLQLGNLLGTNLSLPCVNVKRYLGDSVYNIIDLIISFFLILGIIRLSINIYNRFISMKDISS